MKKQLVYTLVIIALFGFVNSGVEANNNCPPGTTCYYAGRLTRAIALGPLIRHHDVIIKSSNNQSDLSVKRCGFFADDPSAAVDAYMDYLAGTHNGYVDGNTGDKKEWGEESGVNRVSDVIYTVINALYFKDANFPNGYHLTKWNCQHWATYVLSHTEL